MAKELHFQLSTIYDFQTIFIASGIGSDIPLDDGRFLVAVDENGNRLASKRANEYWVVDEPRIMNYSKDIIRYKM
jgi:hypothetical protein